VIFESLEKLIKNILFVCLAYIRKPILKHDEIFEYFLKNVNYNSEHPQVNRWDCVELTSWGRVPREKLTIGQLIKNVRATQRFIAVLKRDDQ
jgi:hypothetical protein